MSEKQIGYAWVIAVELPNKRSISVQGNFELHAPEEFINAEFDKIMGVVDRQRTRAEIPIIEAEMKQRRNMLKTAEEQCLKLAESIEAAAHPDPKRRTQINVANEKTALENAKTTVEKIRADIADGEETLGEMKKKAA